MFNACTESFKLADQRYLITTDTGIKHVKLRKKDTCLLSPKKKTMNSSIHGFNKIC